MDTNEALSELVERMMIATNGPIAHSYGFTELILHELHQDDIDIEQVTSDISKLRENLNRVLLYMEDFAEEYEQLK